MSEFRVEFRSTLGFGFFGAQSERQAGGPPYWNASGHRSVRRASGLSGECKLAL
jgi:hypothetical protein